jgi:hypothetical protein
MVLPLLVLDTGELTLELSTVHRTNPNLSTIVSWNKNKRWSHVSSGNSKTTTNTYNKIILPPTGTKRMLPSAVIRGY